MLRLMVKRIVKLIRMIMIHAKLNLKNGVDKENIKQEKNNELINK